MGMTTNNNNLCFIVFYHQLILGGAESYFFRMSDWCYKNNYPFYVITGKNSVIAPEWKQKIYSNNISIICSDFIYYDNKNIFNTFNKIICITATIFDYLRAFLFLYKNKLNGNLWLYILHPFASIYSKNWFRNFIIKKLILSKIKNNIIFMDEETKKFAINTYPNINFNNNNIIRLGFSINNEVTIESRAKERIILSIQRLEFPFKGYILGLITDFEKLCNKYNDIFLQIIGDGDGYNELINKIKELPINIQKRIRYIRSVNYVKLSDYIKDSFCVVGMGTCLLDAAVCGKPSICAVAYQKENFCSGYFHDNPYILGVVADFDNYEKHTFFELLDNLLQLSNKSMEKISKKCIDIIKSSYSIDNIMNYLLANTANDYKKIKCKKIFELYYSQKKFCK